MKKTNIFALSALLSIFAIAASAAPASAHCPLCTGATVVGIAIAERYGIDSAITGIWVGAFVISTALWFGRIIKKKYDFPGQGAVISAAAMILTIVPFKIAGMFGNPVTIFGMDRLLFGMLFGGAITFGGAGISAVIKKRNGRVLFPFQTIVISILLLSSASAIFFYLIKNTGVLG